MKCPEAVKAMNALNDELDRYSEELYQCSFANLEYEKQCDVLGAFYGGAITLLKYLMYNKLDDTQMFSLSEEIEQFMLAEFDSE